MSLDWIHCIIIIYQTVIKEQPIIIQIRMHQKHHKMKRTIIIIVVVHRHHLLCVHPKTINKYYYEVLFVATAATTTVKILELMLGVLNPRFVVNPLVLVRVWGHRNNQNTNRVVPIIKLLGLEMVIPQMVCRTIMVVVIMSPSSCLLTRMCLVLFQFYESKQGKDIHFVLRPWKNLMTWN